MKSRRQSIRRKRQKFPTGPVAFTAVAAVFCALFYYQGDAIEGYLGKIEIGFFSPARAADSKAGAAKPAGTSKPETAKPAAAEVAAKPNTVPNIKQWTPEELSFFSKLNDRKIELDQREAELVKLEEELQKRKAELDERLKQLEATRSEISKTLKSRVESDQQKVTKLVEFYSSMKPQQAAKVIETLNEDLAVEVLDKMKKKSAAEILNMMGAKKARKLSELLTGYQRSTASTDTEDETAAAEAAPSEEAEDVQ